MREDSKRCTFDPESQYVDLAAEVFSLLSDATRIRIILALRGGELAVGELAERVGKSPTVVSQHLAKLRRHIVRRNALLPLRCDHISGHDRPAHEILVQRLRRTLEPHFLLRGRKNDLGCRLRFHLADFNLIAGTDARIYTLKAIQPYNAQRLVLGIGIDRACSGAALADDFNHITLNDTVGGHELARYASQTSTGIFRFCVSYL